MRILLTGFIVSAISFLISQNQIFHTDINSKNFNKKFSHEKFFVKTKTELKISEATGKISLTTGINSLDDKISKYKIKEIKNLFRLNNGNSEIFQKYGMSRIYLFYAEITDDADNEADFKFKNIVNDFNKDENVEFSEPDYIGNAAGQMEKKLENLFSKNIPNDEMFSRQWYLKNNGSVDPSSGSGFGKAGADIKVLNAWEIETGSDEVVVAILDSGIKDDHPDLRERIWINKKEIPGNNIDDDANGYVDDYKGWDFAYDDNRPEDGFGHGTNIATVIGAKTNNEIGFAGIDQKCKLMNCKNLNADNTGEYGWWSESIKYAADNGAKIINMSEGGDDYSKVLKTAIDYAIDIGVMVNSAMMNKGDNRNYYPACYKGVFAIGATDTDDRRCKKFSWGGGSCWGKHISVVAPGNKIYGLDYESDYNYEVYWSGTSQSTAIVSGIAALLLSQDINRTSDDLKKIIKLTSKDMTGDPKEDKKGWDQYYGYGRVDSYAALTFNSGTSPLIDEEKLNNENFENDEINSEEFKWEEKDEKPSDSKVDREPAKAKQRNPDNGSDENR